MTGRNQSNSSNPLPVNLRPIILIILSITVAAVFYIYTIIAADFDEGAILVPGIMFGVLFLTLTWGTKLRKLKIALAVVAALAFLASGLLFVQVGKYNQKVNRVIAQHVLVTVGRALDQYRVDDNTLPDCIWKCMARELMEKGYWKEIRIPYVGNQETSTLGSIPKLDGWACRYIYEKIDQDNFILKSSGADRRFFTEDDLVYKSGQPKSLNLTSLPIFLEN